MKTEEHPHDVMRRNILKKLNEPPSPDEGPHWAKMREFHRQNAQARKPKKTLLQKAIAVVALIVGVLLFALAFAIIVAKNALLSVATWLSMVSGPCLVRADQDLGQPRLLNGFRRMVTAEIQREMLAELSRQAQQAKATSK